MISSVTSISVMFTSPILHDLVSRFLMAFHSMLSVDKPLHSLDHLDQANPLVSSFYNDSMIQIKDRSSSMDIKSMHTISNGYEITSVLLVKSLFFSRQLFERIFSLEETQQLTLMFMKQPRWPMHMILS